MNKQRDNLSPDAAARNDADRLVHVALASNHRYLPGLKATAASMVLFASDKSRLRFHVLSDGLSETDRRELNELLVRLGLDAEVEYVELDMSVIVSGFAPYGDSHTAFMRLWLCECLSCDWVLYSDVDTLWFNDVCGIWNERDDRVPIAWCRDIPSIAKTIGGYSKKWNPEFDAMRYACSGVCLMNLKKMREFGLVGKSLEFARRWGTPLFVDQDILNAFYMFDGKLLDWTWDCMMPIRKAKDAVVLHVSGIGRSFNGPMTGWRAMHAIWYRFYNDVVLRAPDRQSCAWYKRMLYRVYGQFYPRRWVLRMFLWPFHEHLTDNFYREFFFGWLYCHARWMRAWPH